jgi:hypothetical protein
VVSRELSAGLVWREHLAAGITLAVSRPAERARAGVPSDSHHELEELEIDAILAHQSGAHLPQKRAQVTEEARSIVIAEPAAPGQRPFHVDRGEPTVVIDRRDLEVARKRILTRRRRGIKERRVLWAGLAAIAFVTGGLVVFLWPRGDDAPLAPITPALEAAPKLAPTPPAAAARERLREAERPPPKVSLEELPLERPRRGSTAPAPPK